MHLQFSVPGQPVPKGRPRLGAHGSTFTPSRTKHYEDAVKLLCRLAANQCRWRPTADLRYSVSLMFFTATARRKDIDNLTKAILDAMNHEAYKDDSQVDELHVYRRRDDTRPRVEVVVAVLGSLAS